MCFFWLSKTTFPKHVFISQVKTRKERQRGEKEGIRERRRSKQRKRTIEGKDKKEGSLQQVLP